MHPGDDTGTFLIDIGLVECFADYFVCNQRRLPYDFVRKYSGCVQFVYDDLGMLGYLAETLISVKIL